MRTVGFPKSFLILLLNSVKYALNMQYQHGLKTNKLFRWLLDDTDFVKN